MCLWFFFSEPVLDIEQGDVSVKEEVTKNTTESREQPKIADGQCCKVPCQDEIDWNSKERLKSRQMEIKFQDYLQNHIYRKK